MTAALKQRFFDLYIIQELPKADIISTLGIKERMYVDLVKIAKSMDKTNFTLEDYQKELYRQYITCTDPKIKIDLLRQIGDIVKQKHKIPLEQKDTTKFNFEAMMVDSPESSPAQ